jgi:hypothetical protein
MLSATLMSAVRERAEDAGMGRGGIAADQPEA